MKARTSDLSKSGSPRPDITRRFARQAFTPLFEWLTEQLQYRSSVVFALRRYVYLTERFNRVALDAQFRERAPTGEELYKPTRSHAPRQAHPT